LTLVMVTQFCKYIGVETLAKYVIEIVNKDFQK
jgi:hypothetical protein